MYVRSKKIKRDSKKDTGFYKPDAEAYTYYQLVEGYRNEGGKVKQRVLAHLGRNDSVEAALENWQRRAEYHGGRAADLHYAAEKIRERPREPLLGERRYETFHRTRYGRGKWLLPKAGTEVPERPPFARGVAPKGWTYVVAETPEAVELQAAEHDAKAEEYERRIARLRDVVTKE
jgi:hypothetical protein